MRAVPLVLSLAACGGGGGGAPDADQDRPRYYGGEREVELQIPEDFDESASYPLVMLLHGYGINATIQTAYFNMVDVPSDPGAFFLAPNGSIDEAGNRFWAASAACCGDGVDDVAYLGGLIDDVMADWPVDPARVFVLGHSNGHFMSYRMACERADVVTAIAGLAGAATTVDGSGCDPAAPVSSLHVHGDMDEIVPYQGGDFAPGAVASVMQWADHDGCGDTRSPGEPLDLEENLDGFETVSEIVDGCPAGVGVELWTIQDGVHAPVFHPTIGDTLIDWLMAHPR
jgi:polyhydroxybutyrate depolymerase